MTTDVTALIKALKSRGVPPEAVSGAFEALLVCALADGAVDSRETPILNDVMAAVLPDDPETNLFYTRKRLRIMDQLDRGIPVKDLMRDALAAIGDERLRSLAMEVCKEMRGAGEPKSWEDLRR